MIITIDGPSATGKSTIAKLLAEKLKFITFDTGAMYRCFTWYLLHYNIDYTNLQNVKKALEKFSFKIAQEDHLKHYVVDDIDITKEIRSQQVTDHVSAVAMISCVREKLVHWQRQFATNVNVVFEGRDLGSVVFPQADLKIFLTGSDQIRAERRYEEILTKYPDQAKGLTLEKVFEDLKMRDHLDSTREHSPLVVPKGSHTIDTSNLSITQVVDKILTLIPS